MTAPDTEGHAAGRSIDPEAAAKEYRERAVGPYRGLLPETAVASMEESLSGACTVEIAAFDVFAGLLGDPGAPRSVARSQGKVKNALPQVLLSGGRSGGRSQMPLRPPDDRIDPVVVLAMANCAHSRRSFAESSRARRPPVTPGNRSCSSQAADCLAGLPAVDRRAARTRAAAGLRIDTAVTLPVGGGGPRGVRAARLAGPGPAGEPPDPPVRLLADGGLAAAGDGGPGRLALAFHGSSAARRRA